MRHLKHIGRFIPKHTRAVSFALLVLALGTLLPLHSAQALFGIGNIATDVIGKIFATVIRIFQLLVGFTLLPLAAWLMNFTFRFQEFMSVPFVQQGWTISRDFANMLFILILLAIAFATILKLDNYGVKKALPKFLIVALLINFSLLIGGVIIDVGNDLAEFFVTGGTGPKDIAANMMNALQMGDLLDSRSTLEGEVNNDASGDSAADRGISLAITELIKLVMIILVAFEFLAIGIIMIVRMVALWILLMLAPFAWISYALPYSPKIGGKDGKNIWRKWWDNFLCWSFWPVIPAFFIYLGLLAATSLENLPNAPAVPTSGINETIPFHDDMLRIIQYIAVLFIFGFGVIAAKKAACQGASYATGAIGAIEGWGKTGLKKMGGATGDYGKRKAGQATRAAMYGRDEKGERTQARRFTRGLASTPGARRLLRPINKLGGEPARQIEAATKEMAGKDVATIQTEFRGYNREQKIAALDRLASEGQLKEAKGLISDNDIGETMQEAAKVGKAKKLALSRADLALKYNIAGETTNERGEKISAQENTQKYVKNLFDRIKVSDVENMGHDSLLKMRSHLLDTLGEGEEEGQGGYVYNDLMTTLTKRMGSGHVAKMSELGQENLRTVEEHYYQKAGLAEWHREIDAKTGDPIFKAVATPGAEPKYREEILEQVQKDNPGLARALESNYVLQETFTNAEFVKQETSEEREVRREEEKRRLREEERRQREAPQIETVEPRPEREEHVEREGGTAEEEGRTTFRDRRASATL